MSRTSKVALVEDLINIMSNNLDFLLVLFGIEVSVYVWHFDGGALALLLRHIGRNRLRAHDVNIELSARVGQEALHA